MYETIQCLYEDKAILIPPLLKEVLKITVLLTDVNIFVRKVVYVNFCQT